jgi:hypothetical protein
MLVHAGGACAEMDNSGTVLSIAKKRNVFSTLHLLR